MPYFTYTRLNLYLDLLPVIVFQHFRTFWKAYNKSKQIAQFLQRKFSQIFAQTPLMGICTFSVFLEYNLGFASFSDVFAHMNSLGQGRFLKMYNSICNLRNFFAHFLLRFHNKVLDFCKFAIFCGLLK